MSNTFKKLIRNSILKNKARSFLICLSISLSIALVTGVNILMTSSIAAMEEVGPTKINGTGVMIYLLSVVVGIVIIIFIYSIFKVFTMENVKLYGMLRSIGVRRSKLFSLVLLQGLIYGIISIPIGIFLGVLMCKGFMVLADYFLMFNTVDFPIILTSSSIIFSIVYGLVSIILAVIIPAIKAASISPIDAISSYGSSKFVSDDEYLPYFLKKLMNYKWKLAFSDILKNQSKAAFIIMVFSISLILVITLSATYSFRDEYGKKSIVHLVDFEIESSNGFNEDYIKELTSNPMIEAVNVTDNANACCKLSLDKFNRNHWAYMYGAREGNMTTTVTQLVSYDDELLKECRNYIVSGDIDIDTLEDGVIAFVNEKSFNEQYKFFSNGPLVNLSPGDKVTLDISDFNIKDITYEGEINAVINDVPYSPSWGPYESNFYFIVSNEAYNNLVGKNRTTSLKIRLKDKSEENKMENFLKGEIEAGRISEFSNMIAYLRGSRRDDEFVKYTLLFFTFMLFLVGIIVNINLVIGNIISKRKQYLIYKAIGIKQKQVNRVILIELLFYVILSLVIGLSIGIPLSKVVFFRFAEVIGVKVYKFPYFDVGLYMLLMVTSTVIAYAIAIKQIKKASIIEERID